jgi:hypothetical protein
MHVHPGDQDAVGGDAFEHAFARGGRRGEVGVEGHAGLGKRGLHLRHMHGVAPDHQLIVARCDQIRSVAWRMSEARYRGHARKHFTLSKQSRPVLVGRDLLAAGLRIQLCRARIGLRHLAVVEPVRQFVLVQDQLRLPIEIADTGCFGVLKERRRIQEALKAHGWARWAIALERKRCASRRPVTARFSLDFNVRCHNLLDVRSPPDGDDQAGDRIVVLTQDFQRRRQAERWRAQVDVADLAEFYVGVSLAHWGRSSLADR